MDINLPNVKAEMEAAFAAYETALVTNDVETLDRLFRANDLTIRYGVGENLYGISEIRNFRQGRSSAGLARTLSRTVITTFGDSFATASTLFARDGAATGRQMQTWVKFVDGWKVVAAHVSLIKQ